MADRRRDPSTVSDDNQKWANVPGHDALCDRLVEGGLHRPVDHEASDEKKMIICVNSNTKMSRGKMAAQAVHAALLAVDAHPGVPVVVLGASPAEIAGMRITVHDAGRTEVEPGTLTAGTDYEAAPASADQNVVQETSNKAQKRDDALTLLGAIRGAGAILDEIRDGLTGRNIEIGDDGPVPTMFTEIDRLRAVCTAGDEHLQALCDERDWALRDRDEARANATAFAQQNAVYRLAEAQQKVQGDVESDPGPPSPWLLLEEGLAEREILPVDMINRPGTHGAVVAALSEIDRLRIQLDEAQRELNDIVKWKAHYRNLANKRWHLMDRAREECIEARKEARRLRGECGALLATNHRLWEQVQAAHNLHDEVSKVADDLEGHVRRMAGRKETCIAASDAARILRELALINSSDRLNAGLNITTDIPAPERVDVSLDKWLGDSDATDGGS